MMTIGSSVARGFKTTMLMNRFKGGGRKSGYVGKRAGVGGRKKKLEANVDASPNQSAALVQEPQSKYPRFGNERVHAYEFSGFAENTAASFRTIDNIRLPTSRVNTIATHLQDHYPRLRNAELDEEVENHIILDETIVHELLDSNSLIDTAAISIRCLQLVSEHYDLNPDASVCLISPLFFHDETKTEHVSKYFLTNHAFSKVAIIPIWYNNHFTLAVQEFDSNSVHCNYFDSLMPKKVSARITVKLACIANFLHSNAIYRFENKSELVDRQIDGVNCGAFVTKNVELFLNNGSVQKTQLSGFQKRYHLLIHIVPLIGLEVPPFEEAFGLDSANGITLRSGQGIKNLENECIQTRTIKNREYKKTQRNNMAVEEVRAENRTSKQKQRNNMAVEEVRAENRTSKQNQRNNKAVEEVRTENRTSKQNQRNNKAVEDVRAEYRTSKQKQRNNKAVEEVRAEYRTSKQKQRNNKAVEEVQAENRTSKLKQRNNMAIEEVRAENRTSKQIQRTRKKRSELQIAVNDIDIPAEETPEHYLGKMDVKCTECDSFHFPQEPQTNGSFSTCCSNGKVKFENDGEEMPQELIDLFKGDHPLSNDFFKNIRQYNQSIRLASTITQEIKQKNGPYNYRQLGEFRRAFNCVAAPQNQNQKPTYGQLYMIESSVADGIRAERNDNLNADLLKSLEKMMEKNNYAKAYVMLKDQIEEEKKKAQQVGAIPPAVKLLFSLKPGTDTRRYNMPQTNEVAAVYVQGPNNEAPPAYIAVNEKGTNDLKILSPLDPSVEPMLYPLFNIQGKPGWNIKMKGTDGKTLTLNDYVQYHLAVREDKNGNFNTRHYGQNLFQEWIVDNFLRVDYGRLEYVKTFVNDKIATAYDTLSLYLQQKAEEIGVKLGKKVILPSTYIGSPRYMSEAYDDAMGMVRAFGKPDLFITMTCNPKWKEIVENLLPGQKAADRPDLVARVFRLKYRAMIKYMEESNIFGKTTAYVGTIEFQKRGLPHIHLLFTLTNDDKLISEKEINNRIRAEIPDSDFEPRLHDIIKRNNMHLCIIKRTKTGPVRYMPCCSAENLRCKKRFPKEFREVTEHGDGGYAKYRRRNNGRTVVVSGQVLDNRHVVPYCPKLSVKFNCHINVEHVADVDVVKYLHKYIFKGPDSATIVKEFYSPDGKMKILEYDEIKSHIDCRYLSAPEAAWRLLGYEVVVKSHHVEKLDLHLEGMQKVYFTKGATDDQIKSAKEMRKTKLMSFFELNQKMKEKYDADHELCNLRYLDVPKKFTWNLQKQEWNPRKRYFNSIGRMFCISPKIHHLFHLRLLLLNVGGPTSFKYLRTYEGIELRTYKAACLARGLIENDEEYRKAMEETAGYKMPTQLRFFFAMLLVHCSPTFPQELYDEFAEQLSQDYIRKLGETVGKKVAYRKIEEILIRNETTFANFEMEPSEEIDRDVLVQIANDDNDNYERVQEELTAVDYQIVGQALYEKMNADQKLIVDHLLNVIDKNEEKMNCYFIDGPGGTGKTFVYKTLNAIFKSKEKKVTNMAYTGLAANLLPNGRTTHSTFKFGIDIDQFTSSNIEKGTKEASNLIESDVFIIDEASMISKDILNIMDITLRYLTEKQNIPFGGKIMLFGGDFRQTLPIKEKANAEQLLQLCLKGSNLWSDFKIFKLTKNMRAGENEWEFAKEILEIGDGKANDAHDKVTLPQCCWFNGDLLKEIFAEKIDGQNIHCLLNRAVLATTNKEVHELNKAAVNLIDAESKIYYSVDEIREQDNKKHRYVVELLNSLNPTGTPKHELELKKHTIIMLLRNLDISFGLCNGTRLLILDTRPNVLICKIISANKAGKTVFIPRIKLECTKNLPVPFYRKQFPVGQAFAITINKSQGQTFDKVGLKLDKNECFSHGQLYVAISRVRSWDCLKVKLDPNANGKCKNVVFTEIL